MLPLCDRLYKCVLCNPLTSICFLRWTFFSELLDPVIARALVALHSAVNLHWTTEKLARLCGLSRSSLASHFARLVGHGPIEYLQRWRIAIAKDELRGGVSSIGKIELAVGY